MKEYKVISVTTGGSIKQSVANIQELLNNMASKGWNLEFITGALYIFAKE